MKRRLTILIGMLVLLLVCGMAVYRLARPDDSPRKVGGNLLHTTNHPTRPNPERRATSDAGKKRSEEWGAQAVRLLLELERAEGHSIVLLQASLSSLFSDWGRYDITSVERFLEAEEAAKGSLDGNRRFREDLILAALIGLAAVGPDDAWARYLKLWETYDQSWHVLLNRRPSAHETTGFHLFRAYHRNNPAAALAWLRAREHSGPPIGGALRAVMAETADPSARQRIFSEFCEDPLFDSSELGLVLAGAAEHDPQQAWEMIHRGRSRSDGLLTSESPEGIAYDLLYFWSIRQPEQALGFIVSLEQEEQRVEAMLPYLEAQLPRRPEMVIRAMEQKELHVLRKLFSMARTFPAMLEAGTNWPLVDEDVPLSPGERVRIMREAVRDADLPQSLKDDLTNGMTPYP